MELTHSLLVPGSTGLLHIKLIPVGEGGNEGQEAQGRLLPTGRKNSIPRPQAGRTAYPTIYLLSSVFTPVCEMFSGNYSVTFSDKRLQR